MALLCGRAGCLTTENGGLPAPRAAAYLVHHLLSQKVTCPRFTNLNGGFRPGWAECQKYGELLEVVIVKEGAGLDEAFCHYTSPIIVCMESPHKRNT